MIQSVFVCTHRLLWGAEGYCKIYLEIYGYKHTILYIYMAKVYK